ncbi:MAG: hypothetical protein PUC50_14110 [Bacteroidales bacterium]|nr:hypothetical protein [Bacteroidales bacterium]
MRNVKTILGIMLGVCFMWSCSQFNKQNASTNKSENSANSKTENTQEISQTSDDDEPDGMEWGDANKEPESQGLGFLIKYIGDGTDKNAQNKDFYMFFTSSDSKVFYEYDDEADYGEYALRCYILYRSIYNKNNSTETPVVQRNIQTLTPWINCILDLPQVDYLPKEYKKYFQKLWYDFKETSVYVGKRGYGFQNYRIGEGETSGMYTSYYYKEKIIRFSRYEKTQGDGLDEIPEDAIMITYYEDIKAL